MRRIREIEDLDAAGDLPADNDGEARPAAPELIALHQLLERDGRALLVRYLKSYAIIEKGRHDLPGLQCDGHVVGEAPDGGNLDTLGGIDLVEGDSRPRDGFDVSHLDVMVREGLLDDGDIPVNLRPCHGIVSLAPILQDTGRGGLEIRGFVDGADILPRRGLFILCGLLLLGFLLDRIFLLRWGRLPNLDLLHDLPDIRFVDVKPGRRYDGIHQYKSDPKEEKGRGDEKLDAGLSCPGAEFSGEE